MGSSRAAFVVLVLLPSLTSAIADLDEILHSVSKQNKILQSKKGQLTPLQLLKQSVGLKYERHSASPENETYTPFEEKNVIVDVVLKQVFDSVLKPIYLPYSENVNEDCKIDLKDNSFYNNLKDRKFWALQSKSVAVVVFAVVVPPITDYLCWINKYAHVYTCTTRSVTNLSFRYTGVLTKCSLKVIGVFKYSHGTSGLEVGLWV